MEGDRILSDLKLKKNWSALPKSVKHYLQPVFDNHKSLTPSASSKYELFSLKVLKQCVDTLSNQDNRTSAKSHGLLFELAEVCCSSLDLCPRSAKKLAALTYEKLLLQLARACLQAEAPEQCLSVCERLQTQLSGVLSKAKKPKNCEADGLLKHAYNFMWQAAAQLERAGLPVKFVLDVRKKALLCLKSCGESCDVVNMLNQAHKAEKLFLHPAEPPGAPKTCHAFHDSLLPSSTLPRLLVSGLACSEVVPISHYLLHRAVLAVKVGQGAKGWKLTEGLLVRLEEHNRGCDSAHHLPVMMQAEAVQLWMSVVTPSECDPLSQLDLLGSSLQENAFKLTGTLGVPQLVAALEMVTGALDRLSRSHASPSCALLTPEAFPSLRDVVLGGVACLECTLNSEGASRGKVYKRQLKFLSFLSRTLANLLGAGLGGMEVSRDGPCVGVASADEVEEQERSLRSLLVGAGLPLLQRAQKILNQGSRVLPVEEHKWLGDDAFLLASSLSEEGLLEHACPLMEISCDEILTWCRAGDLLKRSQETNLVKRYSTLVWWLTDSGSYSAASSAMGKALGSLPIPLLECPETRQKLVEVWTRLRRKDKQQQQQGGARSSGVWRGLLKLLPLSLPPSVKVQYLEGELCRYRALDRPPHAPLVSVLRDLVELSSESHCPLLSANCAIQLAVISRRCTSAESCGHVTDHVTPLERLEWVVAELGGVKGEGEKGRLHQLLATAHLWRGLIMAEQLVSVKDEVLDEEEESALPSDQSAAGGGVVLNQDGEEEDSSGKSCDQSEAAAAVCLPPTEEEIMMREDMTRCLAAAMGEWQEAWLAVRGTANPLNQFERPVEVLRHLLLTALLSSAHSQAELAMKSLSILLNLCPPGSLLTQHMREIRAQALALLAGLLVSEGGGVTPVIVLTLEEAGLTGGGAEDRREEGGIALHCSLALAQVHLAQMQLAECQTVLSYVLDHPSLSGRSADALFLCAKAKLLASECLLHRTFDLKSPGCLLSTGRGPKDTSYHPHSFRLTPIELAVDSVKLLWDLAAHKNILETSSCSGGSNRLSSDVTAWSILLCLLRALRSLTHLLYLRGDVRDALYYGREGAMLARSLHLKAWYQEFLLLLGKSYLHHGLLTCSSLVASQLARLLRHSSLLCPLLVTPTTSRTPSAGVSESGHSSDSETPSIGSSSLSPPSPSPSSPDLASSTTSVGQQVQLICLACCHALASTEDVHSMDMTSHMTSISSALAVADDLHSSLSDCKIDLRPVGFTTAMVPPSRSRVKGRVSSGGVLKMAGKTSVGAELVATRARHLLATKQTVQAQQILSKALDSIDNGISSHEDSVAVAWLHHLMGVATAQRLEALEGKEGTWLDTTRGRGITMLQQCAEEFLLSYQLCYPATPTSLLRETCLWLALLPPRAFGREWEEQGVGLSLHFQALSQHGTLAHQTVLSLGRKIRLMGVDRNSKSAQDHVLEIKQALFETTPPSPFGPSLSSLLEARQLLMPPSCPPCPNHTSNLFSHFPPNWTILTITIAPKPHPSSPAQLLVSKVTTAASTKSKPRGRPSRKKKTKAADKETDVKPSVHFECLDGSYLEYVMKELDGIFEEEQQCHKIQVRKEWWSAKIKLDKQMGQCLSSVQEALSSSSSSSSSDSSEQPTPLLALPPEEGPVLLVLGQQLHRLPWEVVGDLQDKVVARTPSVSFAAAHRTMVGYQEKDFVDVNSTYFVVNPGGDLKKTEKLFKDWFGGQEGWEGVVGTAPPTDEFSTALQEKDLYVYCGHGVGRFLKDSAFQSLHCRASALLMGCSSARLMVHGQCDPSGALLGYMLAGCPALVGCLWGVTDGEIDRFCQALIKSLFSDEDSVLSLSEHVNTARSACKLKHLVGAAPVVYGLPVKPRV